MGLGQERKDRLQSREALIQQRILLRQKSQTSNRRADRQR